MSTLESELASTIRTTSPPKSALFGERGARAVVSVSPASLARVNAIAAQYKVAAARIGTVTRGDFRIQYKWRQPVIQRERWIRFAQRLERNRSGRKQSRAND